jgi:hypothetical protein
MPRYVDSSSNQPDETLGYWLVQTISNDPTGLWVQTGYFGYEALTIHQSFISCMVNKDFPIHFVLGANQRTLSALDVKRLLSLIRPSANHTITVVAFGNALFHPKSYVVRSADGSLNAYVGSANLTGPGLGINVEAGIQLSTSEGDACEAIAPIITRIEAWHHLVTDGVFRICNEADIDDLVSANILCIAPARENRIRTSSTSDTASSPNLRVGTRSNLFPLSPRASLFVDGPSGTDAEPAPTSPGYSWTKVLSSSDAQQVRSGTNPTGKLRLSKAGNDIDHKTWFRDVFFDGIPWKSEVRQGNTYEVAIVRFQVTIDDREIGIFSLSIDHAPHRVADQNNVPTVLAWGPELMEILKGTNYSGKTVELTRAPDGAFKLSLH